MRWVLRCLLVCLVAITTAAAPPSEPPGRAKREPAPTTTSTTVTSPTVTAAATDAPGPTTASELKGQEKKKVRAAALGLTIETITWDVIGLDSNDVTTGPNVYPVGVRVCATGGTVADITVTFTWDTANAYVQLLTAATQSITSLADGECADRYFFVAVVRDAAAYNTTRGYHVTAAAPGVATVPTPTPRQLYVEKILSQNRNSVISISGPTTVYEGDTVTYTVEASTAPNGYSQLDTFLTMLSPLFSMLGVDVDYETPAGTTTTSPYADACGWDPNPLNGTYRSCVGPDRIPGGKVGGLITGTYTGLVAGTGTGSLTTAIIDVSGGSYHYNTDFGTDPNLLLVVALPSADLSIDKAAVGQFTAGDVGTYTLTVTNQGPSTSLTPVTVTDVLPEGMTFRSSEGSGWQCSAAGRTVTCSNATPLVAGASSAVTLRVALDAGLAGRQENAATVAGPARDVDPADNTDTAAVDVAPPDTRADETSRASRGDDGTAAGTGLPATGGNSSVPLTALAVVLLAVGTSLRRAATRRPG